MPSEFHANRSRGANSDMGGCFRAVARTVVALLASATVGLVLAACGSSVGATSAANACSPGPGAKCAGANLATSNLSHLNLSNANFSGADLSGADLSSANLSHANLEGADFSDADLTKADLKGANLFGDNFMGADLSGAINSSLNGATASSTQYVVCHTILPSGRLPTADC
jgi:hypothetical protein